MTDQIAVAADESIVSVPMRVDGRDRTVRVEPQTTLLHAVRDELGVTSVRGTCGIGVCGTCTVLVDNNVVSSCIMLAVQARDREVTTSRGLCGPSGDLGKVQRAFVERGAYQCSFCIPAMALTVHAALNDPLVGSNVASVREYLAGNLCRCGTYPEVLQAVTDLVSDAHEHDEGEGPR